MGWGSERAGSRYKLKRSGTGGFEHELAIDSSFFSIIILLKPNTACDVKNKK